MTQVQPWTQQYSPKTRDDFVGNTEAVQALEKWLKQWNRKKPPKKKAVFIYGPPGIGKTSMARVLADEHNYALVEINASDTRNKGSIEETLGRNVRQNVTLFMKKRLILVDEMDGLSGRQDRGGVSAVAKIIDVTTSPMILVANTVKENMESRFRSVLSKTLSIEFKPLKSMEVVTRLQHIAQDQNIDVNLEVLSAIAFQSGGDLRSAINDFEAIARGRTKVELADVDVMEERNRLDNTPNILNTIFTSRSLWEARKTIKQSMIPYDDLFDWIYENLPIVLDDPEERLEALNKLAKADIYQNRARKYDWRLLKYTFDLMTGGIAFTRVKSKGEGYREQLNQAILAAGLAPGSLSTIDTPEGVTIKPTKWLGKDKWAVLNKSLLSVGAKWTYGKNVWVLPYYREPQAKWRFITTYHKRRRMNSVISQIARKSHTSTSEARNEILPLLSHMIRRNESMYLETSDWMTNLPAQKLNYVRSMSFEKSVSSFVKAENYAKYKQREVSKLIEEAESQREKDLSNIERWLQEEKQQAVWKR